MSTSSLQDASSEQDTLDSRPESLRKLDRAGKRDKGKDPSVDGLDVYSTLHRNIKCHILNAHYTLQDAPSNYHYRRHGLPTVTWYACVNKLLLQRTHLTILRKLLHQKYYTAQFLYKLQQFLLLQHSVRRDVCFYQSLSLSGDSSKLPKLNVLCKQIVSLLHDLDSCSIEKLCKSFNIDRKERHQLSTFFVRCQDISQSLVFNIIQSIRTLREIILFEIEFCYLFSNYRSRLYSFIDVVIKFNDMIFHPAVLAAIDDIDILVIKLEDIININVEVASAYIARSLHYKVVSSQTKSVPIIHPDKALPDVMSACSKCPVCNKFTHFLHKYCAQRCGLFIDAISLMLQGAGDNRIISKTDSCTSRQVEQLLTDSLLAALYHQTNSSVFYETRLSCGDKKTVAVHEQFSDHTKKHRHRWEHNYTSVSYTCTQRGLPNSWICLYDVKLIQYTFYKLDNPHTDYYSTIASSHGKQLKLGHVSTLLYQGFQEILGLLQTDSLDRDLVTDAVISHLNLMSYWVLSDHCITGEQAKLLITYTTHIQCLTQQIYAAFYRTLLRHIPNNDYNTIFGIISSLHQLHTFLNTLHKQLFLSDELLGKVTELHGKLYKSKLQSASYFIQLLQDLMSNCVEMVQPGLSHSIKDALVNELPPVSYWKKDKHGIVPSNYICAVLEDVIKPVSLASNGVLPEPYVTRVHHVTVNTTASLTVKYILNNKKTHFSESGVRRLEDDITHFVDYFKSEVCPVKSEVVLSTLDFLELRNELNTLNTKVTKARVKCTCQKHGNWKRLSAPNLCSNCNSSKPPAYVSENTLKVKASSNREIFSDSEIDGDTASDYLKQKHTRKLHMRLNKSLH